MNTVTRNQILAIEYPEPGKLRSRKVVKRSNARSTGKYPSWKMNRMLQWESSHELNAFRLLDANPTVTAFSEQPLTVHFMLDGVKHRHYPDALVELENGNRELWEIKTQKDSLEPEYVARTRLLQAELPNLGFAAYRMVIGEDLGREPRLSTALTLLKFGRQPISLIDTELVRRIIAQTGRICWGSAINGDLGPRGRFVLARLALEGKLLVDFEAHLATESRFTINPTKGL